MRLIWFFFYLLTVLKNIHKEKRFVSEECLNFPFFSHQVTEICGCTGLKTKKKWEQWKFISSHAAQMPVAWDVVTRVHIQCRQWGAVLGEPLRQLKTELWHQALILVTCSPLPGAGRHLKQIVSGSGGVEHNPSRSLQGPGGLACPGEMADCSRSPSQQREWHAEHADAWPLKIVHANTGILSAALRGQKARWTVSKSKQRSRSTWPRSSDF